MRSFVAGTDLAVEIVFALGDDLVVPDVGTVYYTVLNNAGVGISGLINQPVSTTTEQSSVSIAIPQAANAKSLTYENRTVSVKYQLSGQTHFITSVYRLIDLIPMTADAAGCRSLIGLADNELADVDLDVPMAYYLTADDVGKAALDAALIAGNKTTYAANRAIVARALIEVLPSLVLRANASEKSQTASAARLPNINFDKLAGWLTSIYSTAVTTLSGATVDPLSLMGLSTPIDTITGV